MRLLGLMLLSFAAVASGAFAPRAEARTYVVDSDTYAAIAYSPSTGDYGYAYGYSSRWAAERAVLDRCQADDARVVCWVQGGFCALALGDDPERWGVGWSYGNGGSTAEAKGNALEECQARTTGARVVLLLLSDGQLIREAQSKEPASKLAGGTRIGVQEPGARVLGVSSIRLLPRFLRCAGASACSSFRTS